MFKTTDSSLICGATCLRLASFASTIELASLWLFITSASGYGDGVRFIQKGVNGECCLIYFVF